MMSKHIAQKWLILQEASFVFIVPDTDIRPHGTRISDTKYKLTFQCECGPKILAGEKGRIFAKPIVMHNSFQDGDRVNAVLGHEGPRA
jgi:hypothetical protein